MNIDAFISGFLGFVAIWVDFPFLNSDLFAIAGAVQVLTEGMA